MAKERRNQKNNQLKSLNIFLSHKLGKSKQKALNVAAALSVLAGDRMKIIYSADFDRGDLWDKNIQVGLEKANWFILLYDGPDVNHDWCLYEAGYFRRMMKLDEKRKLICLHDPRHSLPAPLRGFTSVPALDTELKDLFKQIYFDPPWGIRRELFAEEAGQREISEKIQKIIKEVTHEDEVVAQFTLSPTFTFHVNKDTLEELAEGKINPYTQVSGDGGWEVAFGKPDKTTAWSWGELVEGLEDHEPWVHQLAGMMSDVVKYTSSIYPSIAIRIKLKTGLESIYQVILRRLEKTVDECRFTFGAAKIITPYQPNNHSKEVLIFHLYNMAWFFRRHFLEKHLDCLNNLKILKPPQEEQIEKEIQSIQDDLKALITEAQVRGISDTAKLIRTFEEPLQGRVSVELQEKWPQLVAELEDACSQNPLNPQAIINAITSMEGINKFFIETCLKELQKFI